MSLRLPRLKGTFLRTRVARRLVGVFVVCAVAPVLALGFLSRRELTKHLSEQKEEDLRRVTEISRNALLERLFATSSEFVTFARTLDARGGGGEASDRTRIVAPSGYRGLGIAGPRGFDPLAGEIERLPLLDADQVRHLASGRPLLVTDLVGGDARVMLAASLDTLSPAETALWGELDPGALGVERVSGHLLPPGGGLCVFDEHLRPVACSGEAAPAIRGSEMLSDAEAAGRDGRGEEILVWEGGDAAYTGTHRSAFLAFELGAPTWTVLLAAPRDAFLQAPRAYEIASMAFLALAIAIMFFLSNILIRRTMLPVGVLSEAARSIAGGEFATIVDVRSGDEFEELAASFNFMSVEVGRLVERLDDLGQGALEALARAIDAKSRWTGGHSIRVAQLSVVLGRELGLSQVDLERLHRGGLLHDMGKVGISSAILDKPGRLSDEEMRAVREHPQIGADILAPIEAFADIIPIVKHHHERYDGKGYPLGLAGEQIPLVARVLQVADVYDALSNDRPYRRAMTDEEIVEDFGSVAGTQFDPEVVRAFIGLLERAGTDALPEAGRKEHEASPEEPTVLERPAEQQSGMAAAREVKRKVVTQ